MTDALAQYLIRRYSRKEYDAWHALYAPWADLKLTPELLDGALHQDPHLAQYLLALCQRALALNFTEFLPSEEDQAAMVTATTAYAAHLKARLPKCLGPLSLSHKS
jgi:hypothetical protein